jgi:hypothetical protein
VGTIVAGSALTVAKESRDEARVANQIAKEVRDRQAGRTIPLLYAHYWDRPVPITNKKELKETYIGVCLHNIGNEPVEKVRLLIFPKVNGNRRFAVAHGGDIESEPVDRKLHALLQPEDHVWLDLKKEVVQYLRKVKANEVTRGKACAVDFDVECLAALQGQETPSRSIEPEDQSKKKVAWPVTGKIKIQLDWAPSAFTDEFLDEFIRSYKTEPQ